MDDEAGSDAPSSSSSSSSDEGEDSSSDSSNSEEEAKIAPPTKPAAPAKPAATVTPATGSAAAAQPAARPVKAASGPSAAIQRDPAPGSESRNAAAGRRTVGVEGGNGEFELSIDALQGRWRHSYANLGMLNVRGDAVRFDSGLSFQLRMLDGVIDMAGWRANQERSTAEVIVWTKAAEPSAVVSWFLEDDLDRPAGEDEGIDSRNIIEGKRRRQSVDYKALEKQIDEEERQRKDVFSDESSEGGAVGSHGKRGAQKEREEAAEAKEVMSAKEWSEHHQRQCAKATELFRQWMFSTATKRHDEILRRKGKLATRLAVGLTGPGRRMLEQELRFYGLKLGFKLQETVVILDAPARTRFQDRHADEWRRAWQQLEEKEKALAAKHEAGSSSGAASQGASGGATGQLASKREVEAPPESKDVAEEAAPNAKRRRLRRVVDDSDEAEAEDAALGDKEAPTHGVQSQSEESPAPGALSHSEAVSAAAVAASDSSALEAEKNMAAAPEATSGGQACSLTTVQEAKARLEASPPPSAEEVSDIVDFLTAASVDATLLAATKIGATVNRVRKAYVGDAALAEKASELVARWRAVWQQFQKEQKQHS
eukprot:TRINITY_DN9710_c0_g1_i2.p1 TRINITY_DN9710_c0_g1~~TRINITY_DN9710_c0_g1_i2.p1  ORF type:complete len:598 (+),score=152.59 TRINITY_DN9710_c0_g1_i2:79-1872(+)